jgi:hypothetical protein
MLFLVLEKQVKGIDEILEQLLTNYLLQKGSEMKN